MRIASALVASAALAVSLLTGCAGGPVYIDNEKAIGGVDAVALFNDGEVVEGSDDFKAEYRGANWYFSSEENKEAFEAAPGDLAPQYGGWCATAMRDNIHYKSDPSLQTKFEGKLYLFANEGAKEDFDADKAAYKEKADENYAAAHPDVE